MTGEVVAAVAVAEQERIVGDAKEIGALNRACACVLAYDPIADYMKEDAASQVEEVKLVPRSRDTKATWPWRHCSSAAVGLWTPEWEIQ